MGWFADIVHKTQELPLPGALKERLSYKSKAHFDSDAERDNLLVKINILTAKNNELMRIANLDPAQQESQLVEQEVDILLKISRESEACAREIAGAFDINLARAEFHLKRLVKHAYLVDFTTLNYHTYLLDRRGREYLQDNDLV